MKKRQTGERIQRWWGERPREPVARKTTRKDALPTNVWVYPSRTVIWLMLKSKPEWSGKHRVAFTLLEMLVVIAVIAVIAILIPFPTRHDYQKAVRIKCASNLKQVGLAFRIWEQDNGDRSPMSVYTNAAGELRFANSELAYRYFQVMSNELNTPKVLVCPDDTNHVAATNFASDFNGNRISYFIGLEADERFPHLFLAGDTHLTNGHPLKNGMMQVTPKNPAGWTAERHQSTGNIVMADGYVQMWNTDALQKFIQDSNITEQLLMPDAGATK